MHILIEGIFLPSYKFIKLVKTHPANKPMSHSLTINRSFPFNVLRFFGNSFDKESKRNHHLSKADSAFFIKVFPDADEFIVLCLFFISTYTV